MKNRWIWAVLLVTAAACSPAKKSTTGEPVSTQAGEAMPKTPDDYRATVTKLHDLVHTQLNVSFDWNNKQLLGSATLTIRPHFYPTNELFLDARGMVINEVKIVRGESYEELAYTYRNDSICITLDKMYTSRDTFKVYVDYISKPEGLPKKGSKAITSDKGLYFINADGSDPLKPQQIWTQGETQSSSVWFPTIDRPNQKTTQEIYITIDTSFVTLSNGLLVSSIVNASNGTRTDYWRQTLPHAPYLFMMAIGKYAVVKDAWRGMEVSYYVEPEFEKYARNIFGNTPEMMEFFSRILGVDYPWEKYAQVVVRDYVSGAMENTTATIYGEFMQKDDRGLLDGTNEDVVSHELIHHWFGDLVTCESWSNLALNESFATYGEYLWNEYKYGRDEADYNGQNDLNNYLREARNKQVDLVRFHYEEQDHMFDHHSYAKGGRVLHMLRKYIGDEAFYASLNLYLNRHRFKAAEIHDLRLACEEVTGMDLNWFFSQWFLDKGHPSLKIDYRFDEAEKRQFVTVSQLQSAETTPIYRLPVAIDIYTSAGVERHRVVINRQTETFSFEVSEKPQLVNFDAQKMLLCVKTDNHTSSEWVALYNKAPLYLDRYEALTKVMKTYMAGTPEAGVVQAALDDAHWNIRTLAIRNSKSLIGADRSGMKIKLMKLATGDPKSDVRNEALRMLSEMYGDDDEVNQLMRKSVNDPSYSVMESAIMHLLDHDSGNGLALVESLERETNPNIRDMVSGFYVLYGTDAQYDYMAESLKKSQGYDSYGAVQNFGKFLLRCNAANAKKGIDLIAATGTGHPQWFVRLGAVQMLSELAKSYGKKSVRQADAGNSGNPVLDNRAEIENELVRKKAEETRNQVKSAEKDPNLLRIYGGGN